VRITLDPATASTPEARIRIEQPAKLAGVGTYRPVADLHSELGTYVVSLRAGTTEVTLRASNSTTH